MIEFIESFSGLTFPTKLALLSFVIAKVSGIVVIPAIFIFPELAKRMFWVAGISILVSIISCLYEMRTRRSKLTQETEAVNEREIVKRLIESGRLSDILIELNTK